MEWHEAFRPPTTTWSSRVLFADPVHANTLLQASREALGIRDTAAMYIYRTLAWNQAIGLDRMPIWFGWSFLPSTLQGIYRSNLLIHYSSIPPSTPRVVPLVRTRIEPGTARLYPTQTWRRQVFGHLRRPATGKFIYARFFYADVTYSRHIFRLYVCSFVFLFCECVHVIETLARHNCVVPQLNIETYSASLIETFVRRGSMII